MHTRSKALLLVHAVFFIFIGFSFSKSVVAAAPNTADDFSRQPLHEKAFLSSQSNRSLEQSGSLICNSTVDFETGIPTDWQVVDNTGGSGIIWATTAAPACGPGNVTGGLGEAACADSNAAGPPPTPYNTELVSPSFNLSTYSTATLSFAATYDDFNPGNSDRFKVDVWNGAAWTTELSWNEDHFQENVSLDLSTYLGLSNVQVRFHYFGNGWDRYVQVDDISLSCVSIYQPAINVSTTSLTSGQAPDSQVTQTLTISNTGTADLVWSISEDTLSRPFPQTYTAFSSVDLSGTKTRAANGREITSLQLQAYGSRKAPPRLPVLANNTLYEQTDNVHLLAANSQVYREALATYNNQAADDFIIPASDGAWFINTIEVAGQYYNGRGSMPFVDLFFYQNNGGLPGTLVYSATGIVPTADVDGQLLVDLPTPAYLTAGTYWVSVRANMNFRGAGQWGWQQRTTQSNNPAAWVNPGDGFVTGCTTWAPLQSCMAVAPDLIFRLLGTVDTACDIPQDLPWLSLSPDSGTTMSNTNTTVDIIFDTTGLSTGIYTGTLCIHSNDLTTPRVQVPVTVTVCQPPTAVSDLAIYQDNDNNAILTWTGTGADYYEVHRSLDDPYFTPDAGTLVYTTTLTTFTDAGIIGDLTANYYYTVVAANTCHGQQVTSMQSSNRTAVFNYKLEPGTAGQKKYNPIAMPIGAQDSFAARGLPFNAQGLLNYVGPSASQVAMLNANTQGLDFWDGTLGFGIVGGVFTTTPFPLTVGSPYMILLNATAPASLTFVGHVPTPGTKTFTLVGSGTCTYNEIAIPLHHTELTNGIQLAASIGNVTKVAKLNAASQALDLWDVTLGSGIIDGIFTTNPDDFVVEIGHAYRVCVTPAGNGTIWP